MDKMMKSLVLFLFLAFLSACNNSAEVKVSMDSVGKKFNDKAEKAWDSTKEGLKNLKNKVEEHLDKKDTIHIDIKH